MKYLLDTNVLSELRKPKGNAAVKEFIGSIREDDLYISAISLGEIAFGVEKLGGSPQKTELSFWLTQTLCRRFEDRIVSLDAGVMIEWGKLRARAARTLPVMDSLIAASALSRRLALLTRNVKDFEGIAGLELYNPWDV